MTANKPMRPSEVCSCVFVCIRERGTEKDREGEKEREREGGGGEGGGGRKKSTFLSITSKLLKRRML